MKPKVVRAWAVVVSDGQVCNTDKQLLVYNSIWEAQMKRLKCLVSQRCLEGYYVTEVEIRPIPKS